MLYRWHRRIDENNEYRFYVEVLAQLTPEQEERLKWFLAETYDPNGLSETSFLSGFTAVDEFGPNLRFITPWSITAMNIFGQSGLGQVERIEFTRRTGSNLVLPPDERQVHVAKLFDRMTEMPYVNFSGFPTPADPEPVQTLLLIEAGIEPLRAINIEMGLGMNEQTMAYVYSMFVDKLKRNPTDVEIFQIAQGLSDHCRHNLFRGHYTLDGVEQPRSMWQMIKSPLAANPGNSVLAFRDNSSAIQGREVSVLVPVNPGSPSEIHRVRRLIHFILTVETHNFPTGVAPEPGAATGVGGMLRDLLGIGNGGDIVMVGAGYVVDHLHIPDHVLEWEEDGWLNPEELASALQIISEASDGASAYGNCIGTPLTLGYCRSVGLILPDGSRIGKFKPTMTAIGVGTVADSDLIKGKPEVGDLALLLGPPALLVGLGGGGASSMVQGENAAALDFNAVQRGDAFMEQLDWRVIRACIALGDENPIAAIHDLGAGGSLNAIPEILLPAGGRVDARSLPVGDPSMSLREIWGCESQERMVLLVHPKNLERFMAICEREGAPCAVVGEVTGSGWIELYDSQDGSSPVMLPLSDILENLPPQEFSDETRPRQLLPLQIPRHKTFADLLDGVLRHISVGSKRFLVEKADSTVGGRVIQQQTVGPNQLPISDYALAALSFDDQFGNAVAIGEQPIKGLISPRALARLGIAEAMLNIVGAGITSFPHIKFSVNWMWPAKEPGEAVRIFAALSALEEFMIELRVAADGGKDSFSMAVRNVLAPDGSRQTVCSPGELVFTAYAPVDNVNRRAQPYLRYDDTLIHVPVNCDRYRLGGSTLGLTLSQLGDEAPDIDNTPYFVHVMNALLSLVKQGRVAIHDISDGGLIVAALEMAFAGNTGLELDLAQVGNANAVDRYFAEEPGALVACPQWAQREVTGFLAENSIEFEVVGYATAEDKVVVAYDSVDILKAPMTDLRDTWEQTGFELAKQGVDPAHVEAERAAIKPLLTPPPYKLTFVPVRTIDFSTYTPAVAVVRAPGTNGDLEAQRALLSAGFRVSDVNMHDLQEGSASLADFQGVFFPGGFAFADVLDSGKGWAGMTRFDPNLKNQFQDFYQRPDTFSIGVCNGCQFMALLGWVPGSSEEFMEYGDVMQPRFVKNPCGRFRRSWVTVQINPSPSILFKDMVGSRLGIWVAHGEGHLHFPDQAVYERVLEMSLAPLSYVGPDGEPTEAYPFNPNGSPLGITSLCSANGRHNAMMPHPERTSQLRQWPWMPDDWRADLLASPWSTMFHNAYEWSIENRKRT